MIDLSERFELASGTIIGREHARSGRNNQDGLFFESSKRVIVAVVCDGCSSSAYSEVGSKIGARMITETIVRHLRRRVGFGVMPNDFDWPLFLEKVRQDVLANIRVLANSMGQSLSLIVSDYFLFTVVGLVVLPQKSLILSIGDGLFGINGEMHSLGPFPGNEPPYLGYGLIDSFAQEDVSLFGFQIQKILSTEEIDSVFIGTDGVQDSFNSAERKIPGRQELVGPAEQFWKEDYYFENPDAIRRKLFLMNKEIASVNLDGDLKRECGILPDDTTLVVLRRKIPVYTGG